MSDREDTSEAEHELARRFARSLRRHGHSGCPSEMGLAAYLDGRTSEREAERIEAHLARCAPCRRAVIEARRLFAEPPTAAPPQLAERAKALAAGPAAASRRATWRAVATWAAAAAAAVAVGLAGLSAGSAVSRARRERAVSLAAELAFEPAGTELHASGDDVFQGLLAQVKEADHE